MTVDRIHRQPRKIICADERSWNALLRTPSKVALGLTYQDVVPDFHRGIAVELRRAFERGTRWVADHSELFPVGIVRGSVAVCEDDHEVSIRLRRWLGSLIEIT